MKYINFLYIQASPRPIITRPLNQWTSSVRSFQTLLLRTFAWFCPQKKLMDVSILWQACRGRKRESSRRLNVE
jgi:cbb3-type cytochrome oxidase subunit 1